MDNKILKWAAILLFPLYAIFGLALEPLLLKFRYDYLLLNTVWFDVIYQIHCWWEPLVLAVLIAFCVFGIARYGAARLRDLYLLCGGALLFKYLSAVVAGSLFWGSLDLTAGTVLSVLFSILSEAAIVAISVFIAHKLLVNAAAPEQPPFRLCDPAQKALLLSALINGALRLVGFVLDDIAFGMYELSDIPMTVIYLFLDIFIPTALAFLLSVAVLQGLRKQKTEPNDSPEEI